MALIETISYDYMIIVGIAVYVFGLIGNILNICVFTIWCRPQRNLNNHHQPSNSSLYLLVSSCANFLEIVYPVLTRILFDGFQRPKTEENEFLICKFRFYVLHTTDLISVICICMATFDRYLISSREVRLRRLSPTQQQTKLILALMICLIGLHNIPIAVYYEVSDFGDCIISSQIYRYYYFCIIQMFFHGIFPICFLSIFGGLTYKQLQSMQQTNHQRNFNSNKQLSRMLLLLCIVILISSVPYCIQNLYFVITEDFKAHLSSYTLLFYYISLLLFFANATLSFCIFFFSTPNFRKQLKQTLRWETCNRDFANNQVHAQIINT